MTRLVPIGEIADMLGVSVSRVRQLADAGDLPSVRTPGGHRRFDRDEVEAMLVTLPSRAARVSRDSILGRPAIDEGLRLQGLREHEIWAQVRDRLGLDAARPSTHIAEYAFEEMLNNAIEHSRGAEATIRWWNRAGLLAFEVGDDGVGAFARVRKTFGLPDDLSAIQELSKGKRTSAPEAHTGQGIFFTSKAVDRFSITCNGWRWIVDNTLGDQTVETAPGRAGTLVRCRIDPATTRELTDVFAAYSSGAAFDTTRPAVRLISYGTNLISRSQARMLLEGLDRFAEVRLDFAGVESVGQGFVDEVFRVWAEAHPDTRITPIGMGMAVEFMVRRGLGDASS